MITRDQVLNLERSEREFVRVRHIYIDMAGDFLTGAVLSEIVYWHAPTTDGESRLRKPEGQEHEWLGCDRQSWWKRSRITKREFDRAANLLLKQKLIFKQTFKWHGQNRIHVRINWEVFLPLFDKLLADPPQKEMPRKKVSRNGDTPKVSPNGDTVSRNGDTQLPNGDTVSRNGDTENTNSTNNIHSKTNSAPNGAGEQSKPKPKKPAEKKPRPPDPLFDAVKEHIFGITDGNAEGGRIGKISNWLKQKYDGPKGHKVGKISSPAKPEHVGMFVIWYQTKYPDTSLPRDFEKFVEHWREWGSSVKSQPADNANPPPKKIADMTAEDFARNKARAMARAKELKYASGA